MSKRKFRSIRHYKPTPSFKERVHAGVARQSKELWTRYGFSIEAKQPEVLLEVGDHVHDEHCEHNH